MNILFICNQNMHRSKTAEELFRDRFETRSAGLYNDNPVRAEQVEWADVVAVMDDAQRTELSRRFPLVCLRKRIISLDVPDTFFYGQKELKELLEKRMNLILPAISRTVF